MVSKIDIALFGALIFGVFLVVRGAGGFLQGLKDPLGLGAAGEAIGGFGETISSGFGAIGDTFSGITDFFTNLIPKAPLTEAEQFDFSGLVGGISPEPTGETPDPFRDAERFFKDFPEIFVPTGLEAVPLTPIPPFTPTLPIAEPQPVIDLGGGLFGGGPSFIGGGEAPLGALNLSAIIDKFMITASQAANIKFIAQQGGDPFADISNIFGENPPAISNPTFQGLSLQEIANRLTGGNISNF